MKKKVILGFSGGVDSAVSAIILKEQGYDVEGMFMRNWDSALNYDILGNPNNPDDICPQEQDYNDAVEAARIIGIKLHRVDFVEEYWNKVFMHFIDEYKQYRTPNPDILCNSEIKFKCFVEKATEMDADYIAMGHYAKITHKPLKLYRGKDRNKDQSYFLCMLTKKQLEKALFPLGNLTKKEVREIARKYKLNIADKKDSTGICFIGERDFDKFLKNYLPAQVGNMETLRGEVVGKHEGLMYYTIGQRKGLGLGGDKGPWFVLGKDIKRNVLLVGYQEDQEYLYSNRCFASSFNWLKEDFKEIEVLAQFRYRSKAVKAKVRRIDKDTIEVKYEPFRAVTPGQAVVFYNNDEMLGGAVIDEVYQDDQRRLY